MTGETRLTSEVVQALAEAADVRITAERYSRIAAALREFHEMSAALDQLSLENIEPEPRFNAGWSEQS